MGSVARSTLALFGCALVIGAAMPASAGEPRDVKGVPDNLAGTVSWAAGACEHVNGPLLAAQIEQESNWNPRAISSAGAQGIAQIKPEVWASFGVVDANDNGTVSVWEAEDAIAAQALIMCNLGGAVRSIPADKTTAMLWDYNAGFEATKAANGQPPTAEADNYARRILNELIPKYRP